ncbi:MAG: FAD-dependent monooxygenase [Acidimicrobiales bacterium]|nr:FAD-dependent monooxygenase [Acidimicrobiales bacterium]
MTGLAELGPVVVVGGGPAGSLLALYLAQRGHHVDLYESRPDLRRHAFEGGRSINLALAARGIVALRAGGINEEIADLAIPMVGRMVHSEGESTLQPYGTEAHEVIYSINRGDLNAVLLDAAEKTGRVALHFDHRLRHVDLDSRRLEFSTPDSEAVSVVEFGIVFGADGANSLVRAATTEANGGHTTEEPLDHGYKELTVPPAADGGFVLDPHALHIWPRGDFMLIALANPEGDFTATLFLPNRRGVAVEGGSFAELDSPEAVTAFFDTQFPGFTALVPDLVDQFFANPTGDLATIRCSDWNHADISVVLGDAAHAIVPFHGQGMNAAMESALALVGEIDRTPDSIADALERFSSTRKPNADAIADMALHNYIEMRSSVVDPQYLIKRQLALVLQQRHPDRFAPRYGMVMFTTIPYADVVERARAQDALLTALVEARNTVDDVDLNRADELISALDPLPAERMEPIALPIEVKP